MNPIYGKLQKIFYSQDRNSKVNNIENTSKAQTYQKYKRIFQVQETQPQSQYQQTIKGSIDFESRVNHINIQNSDDEQNSLKQANSTRLQSIPKVNMQVQNKVKELSQKVQYHQKMQYFYLQQLSNYKQSKKSLEWKLNLMIEQLQRIKDNQKSKRNIFIQQNKSVEPTKKLSASTFDLSFLLQQNSLQQRLKQIQG